MVLFIFLQILYIQGTSGQDLFYFSRHPENQAVITGDPVKLECQVSHRDDIIYYWNLNDTRLNNSTRRHQIGSNLYIKRADRHLDAGEYSCIAENVTSGFSLTSQTANLQVIWMGSDASVQLHPGGSEDSVRPGSEIVLRCITDGNGEIKYDWFRNEKLIQKSEKTIPRNKKLHLKDVSPNDNGIYRCRASNEAGTAESKENFVLKVFGSAYPKIKIVPKDGIVRAGSDVLLDCFFEDSNETRWFFRDSLIGNDTGIVYGNGSLLLRNVDEEDEGFYVCQGIKKFDGSETVQAFAARLTVSYLKDLTEESFEPAPSDGTLITPEKKPFEVACIPPDGYPEPRVWWQDPSGRNLTYTGLTRVDGYLLILEAPRVDSDTGNYACFAENLAGVKKFTIRLIISVEPLVPNEPEIRTVDEGDDFSFSCPFRGTPYPATTFKWKKDDKYLSHNRISVERENGTLSVVQSQPSDRGIYLCQVNTTGFRPVHSKPYKLTVIEKLKFIPRPVSKKLELGTTAKIPCKAQGTPNPLVRWFKDRMMEFPPHVRDLNGTLHFDNVSMTDRGRYTCIATSTQGTINASVDVDVIVAPKFSIKPQNMTEATEGQPLMLHCMADGDPRPTIRWDKNGEMNGFDSQRFQVLDNGTLAVQYVSMEDKGKYGCTAGNSGGLKREETFLIVKSADGYQPSEGLENDSGMMTKTVTITLTAAAGYMFLVIGLMVWCRYRRRKRKQAYLTANPEGILLAKAENGDAIPNGEKHDGNDVKNKKDSGRKSDGAETAHSQSSNQSKKSCKSNHYEKLIFSRENISDLRLIGHGIFGEVFVARAEKVSYPVLVKSLQHTRDENALVEFKRETDMFHRLSQDNLTKIIGLCREAEPHYMIMEYTDWGELKHFLQNTKKEKSKLSTSQIIEIGKQISVGMEHLSNARFVHKDLATRNCVVTSDLRVKVSLIGLSKDVYSNDYAQFRNQLIPLRWLPYEAVFEDDYSTKSDVYSFAVLCWELFHQGERPFHNLPDSVVVERLQRRELIVKPSKSAPHKMAALLTTCAASSPKDRPTFSNIAIVLGETLRDL